MLKERTCDSYLKSPVCGDGTVFVEITEKELWWNIVLFLVDILESRIKT
jgi:hypothetical protein